MYNVRLYYVLMLLFMYRRSLLYKKSLFTVENYTKVFYLLDFFELLWTIMLKTKI